jgi:3D (Asp-Asp-Asp) domain-containing protein
MGLLLFSGIAAVNQAAASANALPAPAALPGFSATLTGYNAVPAQTDDDPGVTASGGPTVPGVVAARSQDLADTLPFGTVIEIEPAGSSTDCGYAAVAPEIGYRVITDTMNARYRDRVDALFPTQDPVALADGRVVNAAIALGVCPVTVRVVGYIDLTATPLPASEEDLLALLGKSELALGR